MGGAVAPRRVLETVVDAACMRAPEPLAIAYSPPFPAGDEGLYSELAWRDRVAVVNESLVIYGALETDSGLYTLSVVGLSDEARQVASVVLVVEPAPVPTPTPDDYDEEDDAGVSERTPVSVPPNPPSSPRRPPDAPSCYPRGVPRARGNGPYGDPGGHSVCPRGDVWDERLHPRHCPRRRSVRHGRRLDAV